MITAIENILSTFIKNPDVVRLFVNKKTLPYWTKSLTHESVNYINNYEKLEFLGDGGLGYAFSIYLREDVGITDHGMSNNLLTHYMSKVYQPLIAKRMGIDKLLIISDNVKVSDDILEDIFESFFGVFEMLCRKLQSGHPDIVNPATVYIRDFFRWYFNSFGAIDLSKGELVSKNFFIEYYWFLSGDSPQTNYSWYYNSKIKGVHFNPTYLTSLANYDPSLAKAIKTIFMKKGYPDENQYIEEVVEEMKSRNYDSDWLKNEKANVTFEADIKDIAKKNGFTRFILYKNNKNSYDLLAQRTEPKTRKSITQIIKSFETEDLIKLKEDSIEIINKKFS